MILLLTISNKEHIPIETRLKRVIKVMTHASHLMSKRYLNTNDRSVGHRPIGGDAEGRGGAFPAAVRPVVWFSEY